MQSLYVLQDMQQTSCIDIDLHSAADFIRLSMSTEANANIWAIFIYQGAVFVGTYTNSPCYAYFCFVGISILKLRLLIIDTCDKIDNAGFHLRLK